MKQQTYPPRPCAGAISHRFLHHRASPALKRADLRITVSRFIESGGTWYYSPDALRTYLEEIPQPERDRGI